MNQKQKQNRNATANCPTCGKFMTIKKCIFDACDDVIFCKSCITLTLENIKVYKLMALQSYFEHKMCYCCSWTVVDRFYDLLQNEYYDDSSKDNVDINQRQKYIEFYEIYSFMKNSKNSKRNKILHIKN